MTEQNLGFTQGGRLTAVDVKVGQKVTAGQVLAVIDDVPLRRTLGQQQGQLDSQRATLTRLVNATTVNGAQNTTAQAQDILGATQDLREQTIQADESAIDRAVKQLDVAKDALDDARDNRKAAEKACRASGGSSGSSGSSSKSSSVDLGGLLSTTGGDGAGSLTDDQRRALEKKRKELEKALAAAGAAAGSLLGGASGGGAGCQQASQAESAENQARANVEAARTTLEAARQRRDVDAASGRVQVENAQQGVVSAQNNLDSARTDRPSLIAAQQGLVDAQVALVRQAQQNVDDATLRAPADGTVTAVNGAVGEFLTSGSGTTALAPGSGASIPGTGSTTAGASAGGGGVARPGGSQFIVLDNVDRFDVVVPFEEGDAVRIQPGQNVRVTFDGVPDLERAGTVTAVSPSATALSGVVSYYVTVSLTESDPRLRNGLTAQAAVNATEVRDVLVVPNAAVRREGGQAVVTVAGFGGQRTVPFTPGVVGDETTQVVSGLTAGDQVVLPDGR